MRTAGSRRTSSGAPEAMTRPSAMTVRRSASAKTASMSCSTISTARPALSERMSAIMPAASAWPMPASGSSRSTIVGSVASTMAISSWRCSPWLRRPAATSPRASSPTVASASRARAATAASRPAPPNMRSRPGARACAASRTFSKTVKGRKIVVFW